MATSITSSASNVKALRDLLTQLRALVVIGSDAEPQRERLIKAIEEITN